MWLSPIATEPNCDGDQWRLSPMVTDNAAAECVVRSTGESPRANLWPYAAQISSRIQPQIRDLPCGTCFSRRSPFEALLLCFEYTVRLEYTWIHIGDPTSSSESGLHRQRNTGESKFKRTTFFILQINQGMKFISMTGDSAKRAAKINDELLFRPLSRCVCF